MRAVLPSFAAVPGSVLILGVLIVLSIWLPIWLPIPWSAQRSNDAGWLYRFLHPSYYLTPGRRRCPKCGYADNAATALRCTNPSHPVDQPDELSEPEEILTLERTRLWGVRILIGLILLASLWIEQPFAIYVALACAVVWMVLPMTSCQRIGQRAFLLFMGTIVVAVGVVSFVLSGKLRQRLGVIDHGLLPTVGFGPVHITLGAGMVTLAAVLLAILFHAVAVANVVVSYLSHSMHDFMNDFLPLFTKPFYRPGSVAAFGSLLSALGLCAVSTLQGLDGIATLDALLVLITFGCVLAAFTQRAVLTCRGRAKETIKAVTFEPIRRPPPPRPLPYARRDVLEQLAYSLDRVAQSMSYTLALVSIAVRNALLRILAWIATQVKYIAVKTARYVADVERAMWQDLRTSWKTLFNLSTAGVRAIILAPGIMLLTSILLASAATAAVAYLRHGDLNQIALTLIAVVAASSCTAGAAVFYVDLSLIPSFFRVVTEDYVAQSIVFFTIYLDAYGLERLVLHAASHFGLMSWALNVVVLAGVVWARERVRKQTAAVSSDPQAVAAVRDRD